jgi:hypothetical protein
MSLSVGISKRGVDERPNIRRCVSAPPPVLQRYGWHGVPPGIVSNPCISTTHPLPLCRPVTAIVVGNRRFSSPLRSQSSRDGCGSDSRPFLLRGKRGKNSCRSITSARLPARRPSVTTQRMLGGRGARSGAVGEAGGRRKIDLSNAFKRPICPSRLLPARGTSVPSEIDPGPGRRRGRRRPVQAVERPAVQTGTQLVEADGMRITVRQFPCSARGGLVGRGLLRPRRRLIGV